MEKAEEWGRWGASFCLRVHKESRNLAPAPRHLSNLQILVQIYQILVMFSHSLIQSVTICLVIKNEMYELAQHPSLPQEPMKEHVFISSQTRKPPDRTLRKSSLKFSHGRDFAQSSFCSITAPCPPPPALLTLRLQHCTSYHYCRGPGKLCVLTKHC